MEELIQIIVVVAFVLLSMLEGAARKRRAGRGAGAGAGTEDQAGPRPEHERPLGTTSGDDEEFESSETLVPETLWEEIAQLARGGDRTPDPAPIEDAPRVLVPRSAREPERTPPPAPVPVATVERPVSGRVVPDAAPAPSRPPTRRPHRSSLGGLSGRDALRRAIVLKEVLGPPVCLRSRVEQ